jgi:UDP-N-acetylmuramoyl-L-alanyl-D-glutamate--2,6-diaminopimelate ligase
MPQIFLKDLINSELNTPVTKVCQSWQEVEPGAVFVAIKGEKFDGHDFLKKAKDRGALLLVASDKNKAGDLPCRIVKNTRSELSRLAALFYGEPSKKMQVVGITGTNGKTTTNWMIYHMLLKLEKPSMRHGTFGFETNVNGKIENTEGTMTTPDALVLHKDLATALTEGASAAVLEISSHALAQCRVDDLHFDVAVYTNLTRDHLDYHSGMEEYFNAKAKIFSLLSKSGKKNKRAVINLDCEYGQRMCDVAKMNNLEIYTYGKSKNSDFYIEDFSQGISGSKIKLTVLGKTFQLNSRFIGYHNAENASAAIASCISLGYAAEKVIDVFSEIPQVPGRLESVGTDQIGIFVDYAHTPDALENVLRALKPLVKNSLWVLFGCGGDRDKGKRPIMAQISAKYADKVVVTSDNPRTENPEEIIRDIMASNIKLEFKDADRRAAIERTIRAAAPGDIVLIAGKGHENYQVLGTEKIHFSDVEEVERALKL